MPNAECKVWAEPSLFDKGGARAGGQGLSRLSTVPACFSCSVVCEMEKKLAFKEILEIHRKLSKITENRGPVLSILGPILAPYPEGVKWTLNPLHPLCFMRQTYPPMSLGSGPQELPAENKIRASWTKFSFTDGSQWSFFLLFAPPHQW